MMDKIGSNKEFDKWLTPYNRKLIIEDLDAKYGKLSVIELMRVESELVDKLLDMALEIYKLDIIPLNMQYDKVRTEFELAYINVLIECKQEVE